MPDEMSEPAGSPAPLPEAPLQPGERDAVPHVPSPERGVRWIFMGSDGLRAGWSLLIYTGLFAALAAGIVWLMLVAGLLHRAAPGARPVEQRATVVVLTEGGQFAAAAFAAWLMALLEKRRFAQFGLGSFARRAGQFAGGALIGVATLSALAGVLWWRHLLLLSGTALHGAPIVEWGLVWAIAFLAVGLFEEYLTRGYIQYTLARGVAGISAALGMGRRSCAAVGFWTAALILSLLFGLGHKGNAGESPVGIVSAGLIGLLFAFTLWRTGSLWFAVGWHAAWDWGESFLWSVPDSGLLVQHHLTNATPAGPVLWSGGTTGPEGSWLVLPVILLSAVLFALILRPEPGSPAAVYAAEPKRNG